MELIYRLDMTVTAPTKTTTKIVLEALGVKVERSAGSVKRALEETLTEFAHLLREPLLKEARAARAQEQPPAPAVVVEKDLPVDEEEEDEGLVGALPDHFAGIPRLFSEGSGVLATVTRVEPAGNVTVEPFAPPAGSGGDSAEGPLVEPDPLGHRGLDGYISGLTVP